MSLMDQLTQVVVGQVAKEAAAKTGLSEGLAAQMMPAAMAMLMNGLKKNASTPEGAEALAKALDRHDGSLLNNVGKLTDDSTLADGQKILGHILGSKQGPATSALAKSGVSESQIGSLLAMAAPAVLASLGRAKREQGLDISGLAGLVTEEGVRAEKQAPNELSGLMKLIDKDGDGNVTEEIMGMGAKMLGGLFKK
jgi:hypothetical protein